MRGQTYTLTVILLLAVGVVTVLSYYVFSQHLFQSNVSRMDALVQKYHDLASQYLTISSATARLRGNISEFSVRIVNQGDVPVVPYDSVSIYLYKGTDMLWSGKSTCDHSITPTDPCILSFSIISDELSDRRDFSDLTVYVYVNEVPLSSHVEFLGKLPGTSLFVECNSCAQCSSVLASAAPGTIIVVHPSSPSPNCLDISGARDITIYCADVIEGGGTGDGIRIRNSTDVTIKNCEITNFSRGVYVENSQYISFSAVYSHDNTFDLYVSPSTVTDVCSFDSVDFTGTAGPLLFVDSSTGDISAIRASAVWAVSGASAWIHSASAEQVPLSRVSPSIVICNTGSTVRVTDFSVSGTDLGLVLYNAVNPRLENVDISANVRGVFAVNVVGGSMSSVTVSSPGTEIFQNPSAFQWGYGVVFR